MTRLLRPLFHNASTLLSPSAVTPPPSVSSHGCSPAPTLRTQRAPADCSDGRTSPAILVPEPASRPLSAAKTLHGEFDPLRCSPSQTSPLVTHWSAPPSLSGSPHERALTPHPYSSSSVPFLSSPSRLPSLTPLSLDSSGSGSDPHSRSRSASQCQFQPKSRCGSHRRSLSQPLQPSSAALRPQGPRRNPEEAEWGERTVQLSFVDEGQPSA